MVASLNGSLAVVLGYSGGGRAGSSPASQTADPKFGCRGHAKLKGLLGVPRTEMRVPNQRLYVYRLTSTRPYVGPGIDAGPPSSSKI